jgi:hypothetical protein
MNKYQVYVEINLLCHCRYVEVKAKSLEKACEKAQKMSDNWEKPPEIYYEANYAREI